MSDGRFTNTTPSQQADEQKDEKLPTLQQPSCAKKKKIGRGAATCFECAEIVRRKTPPPSGNHLHRVRNYLIFQYFVVSSTNFTYFSRKTSFSTENYLQLQLFSSLVFQLSRSVVPDCFKVNSSQNFEIGLSAKISKMQVH